MAIIASSLFSLLIVLSPTVLADGNEQASDDWQKLAESGFSSDFSVAPEMAIQCIIFEAENLASQQAPRCSLWKSDQFIAEFTLPYSQDVKHAEKEGDEVALYLSSNNCSYRVAFDFAGLKIAASSRNSIESKSVNELQCWR